MKSNRNKLMGSKKKLSRLIYQAGKTKCGVSNVLEIATGKELCDSIGKCVSARAHLGWIEYAARFEWHAMVSLDFRIPRKTPEGCQKAFVELGKALNLRRAFWTFERHKDEARGLHGHGLILFRNAPNEKLFYDLTRKYGICDYQAINEAVGGVRGVALYITKHISDSPDNFIIPYLFPERPEMWDIENPVLRKGA